MKSRVLVAGWTGNIGKACMARGRIGLGCSWGGRSTGVDLQRWAATDIFVRQHKPWDLVIMAHGVQRPGLLASMSEDDWCYVIEGNLSSTAALTTALMRNSRINQDGLIVYCSSIQASTPRAGRGAYAAAKAGLEALAKTVAAELTPRGRALALRLGQLTDTMAGVRFTPEERAKLEARSYLPWVDPKDVARLIFDLYAQPSLTGCVIDVDSGHGRNVW